MIAIAQSKSVTAISQPSLRFHTLAFFAFTGTHKLT